MPDPTTTDAGAQVDSVEPTTKERILKGIGGAVAGATGASSAGLDAAIEKHQTARLNEARMHRKNASTYAGILATGKDPTTGQPLSPEEEQKYQDWYNASMAAYEKAAGVNKETKGAIGKAKMVAEHIIGLGRKQREQGGQGGAGGTGAQPAGLPLPPQRTGTEQVGPGGGLPLPEGTVGGGGGGLPPPPGYTPQVAMGGDELRRQVAQNEAVDLYKRKEQVLYDNKVREDAAKAKAKQQNTPRPVKSNAMSVLDARTLAESGKIFVDGEGNAIDVNNLPENMGLISFVVKNPDNGQWETVYQPFSPNQSIVTIGKDEFAVNPMDKSKLVQGKGTELGPKDTPTTSHHYDPTTGQTDTTTRTPTISGIPGRPRAGGLAPPPAAATRTGAVSTQRATTGGAKAGGAPKGVPPLDKDGHIPAGAAVPQVVEGANQLLDGVDKDKLPAKTRELASSLARKYGWEQGKFTPKEQVLLRESTTFLQGALDDPALSALDDNWLERQKLTAVLANPDKQGFVGRGAASAAAMNLSPKQQEFVRMYNQLVGTVSGLSQLVRSGKATEAQIERLKAELPNPTTTANSTDAKKRLQRLLKEVDVALAKGQFTGRTDSKLPAPPKGSSSSSSPSVIQWTRDAQGNPVRKPAAATAGP